MVIILSAKDDLPAIIPTGAFSFCHGATSLIISSLISRDKILSQLHLQYIEVILQQDVHVVKEHVIIVNIL